jgi:hypothetical protein
LALRSASQTASVIRAVVALPPRSGTCSRQRTAALDVRGGSLSLALCDIKPYRD